MVEDGEIVVCSLFFVLNFTPFFIESNYWWCALLQSLVLQYSIIGTGNQQLYHTIRNIFYSTKASL